jgi:ubiquitin carboxyl-terminal hydrolase 22/27/51
MNDVFSQAKMSDESIPACAVNLLYASWKAIPYMAGRSQQDAQEWFIQIVDKLHETVRPSLDKKGRCRCFFHKVFFGRLRSEVSCDTCGAFSITHEPYSSISLDFKKQVKKKKKSLPADVLVAVPNVQECLKTYTTPEILSPESYQCQTCAAPRQASKRLRIRKLPAILCVHVKRFGMNMSNGTFKEEKYGGKIGFPLTLNMTPFTTRAESRTARRFIYDLECVVVHQGDQMASGHYFSFCRQEEGKWYRFDDEIVTATTVEDVLGQEAYLLFYGLRDVGRA